MSSTKYAGRDGTRTRTVVVPKRTWVPLITSRYVPWLWLDSTHYHLVRVVNYTKTRGVCHLKNLTIFGYWNFRNSQYNYKTSNGLHYEHCEASTFVRSGSVANLGDTKFHFLPFRASCFRNPQIFEPSSRQTILYILPFFYNPAEIWSSP